VNAHTLLPKDPQFYTEGPKVPPMPPLRSFERVFSRRIVTCIAYYCGIALHRRRYPHYKHYRSVGLAREGLQWIRAGWRKLAYKRPDLQRFRQFSDKQFYLLPLQVRGDSQIMTHSRFEGMEQVIARSIAAFANGAPTASHLVIKHHPMDRGYTNYHKLITNLAARFGVADRVWYVHDINLPTLLKACRGVITVNSTVGLSALIQRKPVIVLGEALYNMPGLTFQGSLRDFWTASFAPDDNLAHRFVEYLRYWTQMNACSATKQANFALLDRLPEFRVQAVTGKVRVMKPKPIDPTSGSLGNQAHPALVPISSSSQPPTLASVHLLPSSHSEPQPRSSTTQQEVALAT
jgi:capsular polysaccharide export protein